VLGLGSSCLRQIHHIGSADPSGTYDLPARFQALGRQGRKPVILFDLPAGAVKPFCLAIG
jgi:hypothetical protein